MKRSYIGTIILLLAASAFAQTTTQPLSSDVDTLRAQVIVLQAQVADLQKQLAATKKPVAASQPATRPAWMVRAAMTPIERAMADHTLCNGMTRAQADKSLGVQGNAYDVMHDPGVVQWNMPDAKGEFSYRIQAQFSDGPNGVILKWAKLK